MMGLAQSKCASLLSNMQVVSGLTLLFVIARIAAQHTNLPNSKIFLSTIFIEMCHSFLDIDRAIYEFVT
jgi:hypothetical protein